MFTTHIRIDDILTECTSNNPFLPAWLQ